MWCAVLLVAAAALTERGHARITPADAETAAEAAEDAATEAEGVVASSRTSALAAAEAAAKATFEEAQKLAHDYQTKAQELATAGNILKQQSITLAGSAEHYQYTGNVVQANQIMVQAHSLFRSADADQAEANKLKATADEVAGMIPSYSLA